MGLPTKMHSFFFLIPSLLNNPGGRIPGATAAAVSTRHPRIPTNPGRVFQPRQGPCAKSIPTQEGKVSGGASAAFPLQGCSRQQEPRLQRQGHARRCPWADLCGCSGPPVMEGPPGTRDPPRHAHTHTHARPWC